MLITKTIFSGQKVFSELVFALAGILIKVSNVFLTSTNCFDHLNCKKKSQPEKHLDNFFLSSEVLEIKTC